MIFYSGQLLYNRGAPQPSQGFIVLDRTKSGILKFFFATCSQNVAPFAAIGKSIRLIVYTTLTSAIEIRITAASKGYSDGAGSFTEGRYFYLSLRESVYPYVDLPSFGALQLAPQDTIAAAAEDWLITYTLGIEYAS